MIHVLFRRLVDAFEQTWKPGDWVDEYQIIRLVGKGSYGTTYSVLLPTGEEAILKRIRPYKKLFSNHVQYVQNERDALITLSHPNFPAFIRAGEYKGISYFVMKKMSGRTFEELIFQEGKKYSEEESLRVSLQLLTLVDVIHQKGYVHRDLRIPNILSDHGAIHIIDFGLACVMETESPVLEAHKDYMRDKSKKSDYYAIGHFLLFLLYSSYEPVSSRDTSWEEELPIHHDTKAILRKLLQIDGEYLDGSELIEDLVKVIHIVHNQ
ncbi:serine/threonine protein kinase [Rossellomorea vietnamensis]|uniref:Protein kinase n=1 Tax=Rossellomorea vietnamensis TaxID=218284 RepID=A0A6I6UG62_9BACI|nr:protein kinase [Rossellomorea vietnamensis]QHE61894.1 protein kinase [Rossellomorea vietnamensis]